MCARVRGGEPGALGGLCLVRLQGVSTGGASQRTATAEAAGGGGYLSRSVVGGCAQITGRPAAAEARRAEGPRSSREADAGPAAVAGSGTWISEQAGQVGAKRPGGARRRGGQARADPTLLCRAS